MHPDDAQGESDFEGTKSVKWEVSAFDGKTTSWRRLHCGTGGDKDEGPAVDRAISRHRLQVQYNRAKVAKHSVVWSLITSALKIDADKQWLVGRESMLLSIAQKPKGRTYSRADRYSALGFSKTKSRDRGRRYFEVTLCAKRNLFGEQPSSRARANGAR